MFNEAGKASRNSLSFILRSKLDHSLKVWSREVISFIHIMAPAWERGWREAEVKAGSTVQRPLFTLSVWVSDNWSLIKFKATGTWPSTCRDQVNRGKWLCEKAGKELPSVLSRTTGFFWVEDQKVKSGGRLSIRAAGVPSRYTPMEAERSS